MMRGEERRRAGDHISEVFGVMNNLDFSRRLRMQRLFPLTKIAAFALLAQVSAALAENAPEQRAVSVPLSAVAKREAINRLKEQLEGCFQDLASDKNLVAPPALPSKLTEQEKADITDKMAESRGITCRVTEMRKDAGQFRYFAMRAEVKDQDRLIAHIRYMEQRGPKDTIITSNTLAGDDATPSGRKNGQTLRAALADMIRIASAYGH